MIKHILFIFLSVFIVSGLSAQYYYKDLVSNNDALAQMAKYKTGKIKTISIKSFEYNGEPSADFYCEKKFDKKYTSSELMTRSSASAPSLMTTYYDASGRIVTFTDSSENAVARNQYEYDAEGRTKKITNYSHSQDEDFVVAASEQHIYYYGNDKLPDSMIKVKNLTDSVTILFAKDESGHISIEKNLRTAAKYYYYYDKAGRITDVVLTSSDRPGLHPQYVFTYNSAGDITQMITAGGKAGTYSTWKYAYDNGLRVAEKLYGKDRKLAGSIEYTYK